uniref:Uncharacterized protein n=1 Tax=Astyanax mexicanus TaxID=7994 RepID=A0A8B9HN38_ASTMX
MEVSEEVKGRASISQSAPNKPSFLSPAQFITDLSRVTSRGSTRFGFLSHNSFFSRHNPHPHRVTHISGGLLHTTETVVPLIIFMIYLHKSLVPEQKNRESLNMLLSVLQNRQNRPTPAGMTAQEITQHATLHIKQPANEDEDPPRRKTQYSAQTGRIIPSSSWGTKRRDTATGHRRPATHRSQPTSLDGQELRVIHLNCPDHTFFNYLLTYLYIYSILNCIMHQYTSLPLTQSYTCTLTQHTFSHLLNDAPEHTCPLTDVPEHFFLSQSLCSVCRMTLCCCKYDTPAVRPSPPQSTIQQFIRLLRKQGGESWESQINDQQSQSSSSERCSVLHSRNFIPINVSIDFPLF